MSNPQDWEDLASRLDDVYTVEDFETAAYRLAAEQVEPPQKPGRFIAPARCSALTE
jgi:hypothetical protein